MEYIIFRGEVCAQYFAATNILTNWGEIAMTSLGTVCTVCGKKIGLTRTGKCRECRKVKCSECGKEFSPSFVVKHKPLCGTYYCDTRK